MESSTLLSDKQENKSTTTQPTQTNDAEAAQTTMTAETQTTTEAQDTTPSPEVQTQAAPDTQEAASTAETATTQDAASTEETAAASTEETAAASTKDTATTEETAAASTEETATTGAADVETATTEAAPAEEAATADVETAPQTEVAPEKSEEELAAEAAAKAAKAEEERKKREEEKQLLASLKAAFDAKQPLEAEVVARNKGGLELRLQGRRAFCPASHIELRYCDNIEKYVGQTLTFHILEWKENGRQIVMSRRAILEAEAKESAVTFLQDLQAGSEHEGVVTSLTSYGAFVEIAPTVEGLVHVSEISHQRTNNPKDVLQKGQKVQVKVLQVDPTQQRISLSMKALEKNPWQQAIERFPEDTVVNGKVVRVEDFGAFVELLPGIDGLIHISELSHQHIQHPNDVVNIGETIEVKVLRNDAEKRRIGLSIKALTDAPANAQPRAPRPKRERNQAPRNNNRAAASSNESSEKVFGTLGDMLKNIKINN